MSVKELLNKNLKEIVKKVNVCVAHKINKILIYIIDIDDNKPTMNMII